MRKRFYSLVFKDRNQSVKKYAAIHARIFNTTKKIMIFHKPELKIGDGGGCITF
jgi:hypothetical protein